MKAQAAKLAVGDRVLLKILAHDGKHKLADKWSEDVYIVTEQPNSDIPVYKVKQETGEGVEKTLHRNHLLHTGDSLSDDMTDKEVSVVKDAPIGDEQMVVIPVPIPRKQPPIPKPRKKSKVKETVAEPCRKFVSISDNEEDEIVVSKTTVSIPNHHTADEEVGASFAAAPVAADGLTDNMSTHEIVGLMDDGDAHLPDQQMTEVSEDNEIRAEANNSDDTATKTVDTEANATAQDTDEVQISGTGLRRSTRVRKKPSWQEKGEFCMVVTDKSLLLQSLLHPGSLSQFSSDHIYAIVKGISDTI